MFNKFFLSILLFIFVTLFSSGQLYAQEEEGEIIIISERVGKEIDPEERDKFKLFQEIKGFQSAVYIKLPDGRYFLKITYLDENTGELKINRIQQSEGSMKIRGKYIDHFEEIQARREKEEIGEIEAPQDTVYQEPIAALFYEVFGKPFGSLNLDIRIKKSSSVSLGIIFYSVFTQTNDYLLWVDESKLEDGEEVEVHSLMPNIMYYYLIGEKNKRFEIGGGFSVRPVWHEYVNGDFPLAFHGVIGYRYQKRRGLLFRVGLTPSYWPDAGFAPEPWIAISFGYSL